MNKTISNEATKVSWTPLECTLSLFTLETVLELYFFSKSKYDSGNRGDSQLTLNFALLLLFITTRRGTERYLLPLYTGSQGECEVCSNNFLIFLHSFPLLLPPCLLLLLLFFFFVFFLSAFCSSLCVHLKKGQATHFALESGCLVCCPRLLRKLLWPIEFCSFRVVSSHRHKYTLSPCLHVRVCTLYCKLEWR